MARQSAPKFNSLQKPGASYGARASKHAHNHALRIKQRHLIAMMWQDRTPATYPQATVSAAISVTNTRRAQSQALETARIVETRDHFAQQARTPIPYCAPRSEKAARNRPELRLYPGYWPVSSDPADAGSRRHLAKVSPPSLARGSLLLGRRPQAKGSKIRDAARAGLAQVRAAQACTASPNASNSGRDTGSALALNSGCHCTASVKPGASLT